VLGMHCSRCSLVGAGGCFSLTAAKRAANVLMPCIASVFRIQGCRLYSVGRFTTYAVIDSNLRAVNARRPVQSPPLTSGMTSCRSVCKVDLVAMEDIFHSHKNWPPLRRTHHAFTEEVEPRVNPTSSQIYFRVQHVTRLTFLWERVFPV
jgi:hypothetical protein